MNLEQTDRDPFELLAANWAWVLITGILCVLLAGVALSSPFAASWAVAFTLAALLTASGIMQAASAVRLRKLPGASGRGIQAAVTLIGGLILFRSKALGLLGISIVLMSFFFTAGVSKWLLASQIRSRHGTERGAAWIYVGSIASITLGVLMLITFPYSAFWFPGVMLGIDLLFTGATLIGMASILRSSRKRLEKIRAQAPRPPQAA